MSGEAVIDKKKIFLKLNFEKKKLVYNAKAILAFFLKCETQICNENVDLLDLLDFIDI